MDFDSDRIHLVNMIRLGLVEVLDFSNWSITVFNPGGSHLATTVFGHDWDLLSHGVLIYFAYGFRLV